MTTKADFTRKQWDSICLGPTLAGVGVSVANPGRISSFLERQDIARTIARGEQRYADNELIRAVVKEIDGNAKRAAKAELEFTGEKILTKLAEIAEILERGAAPGDVLTYKTFLYDIADHAAHAAGVFWGVEAKVSPDQWSYLKKLSTLLFSQERTKPAAKAAPRLTVARRMRSAARRLPERQPLAPRGAH